MSTSDRPDLRPIIVGVVPGAPGADALALGAELAGTEGTPLLLAYVQPFPYLFGSEESWRLRVALEAEAEQVVLAALDSVPDTLRERTMTKTLFSSSEAHALYELAEEEQANAVVIGPTHHGKVGQVVIGTVGERLLHGSPCPVAIAPAGFSEAGPRPLRQIGVAFDGSDESWEALREAASLARSAKAHLSVISVVVPVPEVRTIVAVPNDAYRQELHTAQTETLARALSAVEDVDGAEGVILDGHPEAVLVQTARERDLDLLVLGSRGYGPIRRVLLGSVSAALVHCAPCALLVVPRVAAAPSDS